MRADRFVSEPAQFAGLQRARAHGRGDFSATQTKIDVARGEPAFHGKNSGDSGVRTPGYGQLFLSLRLGCVSGYGRPGKSCRDGEQPAAPLQQNAMCQEWPALASNQ